MPESVLKRIVARLEEALTKESYAHGPDHYVVRGYDIRVLFETIKRFGGRRDWLPDQSSIAELPGPVRRHVRDLELKISQLRHQLVDSEIRRRALERALEEQRRPRR